MSGDIYSVLGDLDISYQKYEHPALFSCDDAIGHFDGIDHHPNKTLFLRNRRGRQHYMVVLSADKQLDLKNFAQVLGESQLSFASPERLERYLRLKPGSVSPFGLIHDTENHVQVFIDQDIMQYDTVFFHPDTNTLTLEIPSDDFQKFLASTGNSFQNMDFS